MDLIEGRVVKAKAGRDKDQFFVIVGFSGKEVVICNGKRRTLLKPKKKNIKHLAFTSTVLTAEELSSDKKIKKVLNKFGKL